MVRKISILFIGAILITFSSCVSKKKYIEMEAGRLKAEELSRKLDEENNAKSVRIEGLIADFESMKNELMENNAIKDHYIDSLNGEIFTLAENVENQMESLKKSSFTLDFEQQRLTDALKEKDKSIAALHSQAERLETEISAKNSAIDQRNFEMRQMRDETEVLQSKIKTGDSKLIELQSQLDKVKSETVKLQEQIKEKDANISRLENIVKLLKRELGQ
jgi:chromosome segregation ATPase